MDTVAFHTRQQAPVKKPVPMAPLQSDIARRRLGKSEDSTGEGLAYWTSGDAR